MRKVYTVIVEDVRPVTQEEQDTAREMLNKYDTEGCYTYEDTELLATLFFQSDKVVITTLHGF